MNIDHSEGFLNLITPSQECEREVVRDDCVVACVPDKVPLISFFTGGGFLDLGFERAGYQICWTNEFNPVFADLHDHGYTAWRRSLDPLAPEAKITSRESIRSVEASDVLQACFGNQIPRIFGVVGGPPCTDFSIGGVNAGGGGSSGRLTGVYVKKLLQLRPAFFVLENVPGLRKNSKHARYFYRKIRDLRAAYNVHIDVLNALEFGVPQDRERLFVIGIRKDLDPNETPFSWPKNPKFLGAKNLPWPGENIFGRATLKPDELPEELMAHFALGGEEGLEHLPNGREWFQPYSRKFKSVPEGRVNTKSFKRLHRFRYSPTAWYGNNEIHLHPTEPRRLSVREALRLQTVPDEYVLPDEAPLSKKFKLICNGVPVVLAETVARAVHGHLRKLAIIGP